MARLPVLAVDEERVGSVALWRARQCSTLLPNALAQCVEALGWLWRDELQLLGMRAGRGEARRTHVAGNGLAKKEVVSSRRRAKTERCRETH